MAAKLDADGLAQIFQKRPDIISGIKAASDSPVRIQLFNNIIAFVADQLGADTNEPASKKRRIDVAVRDGTHAHQHGVTASNGKQIAAEETVLLEIKEISLSIPQRKKFDLCLTESRLYARGPGTTGPGTEISYAWTNIEHVFRLPVPEKAQLQYNYVLLPQQSALASLSKTPSSSNLEPLVFTVPATPPKPGVISGSSAAAAAAVSDTYVSLFDWAINKQLAAAGNTQVTVIGADPKIFHSVQRQAHRPNEQAVHVKAFRGSKDGVLFFLPTGILWAFKKPLLFIPLDRVVAVSYTSVLQRTFNIVVEIDMEEEKTEEVEFAMVDQEDYDSIDQTYVRRHGLQDRSMADRRKAKRELAENAKNGTKKRGAALQDEEEEEEAAPDDGLTELQRAEQQLQDEEDELEEDYDPGSEGDSGGSGESDDNDEDDSDADD